MRTTQDGNWAGEKGHKKGHKNVPFWVLDGFAKISASALERMAGTTRLELATSAVTGQRSNQLNYVPTLFSYLCRKPAYLLAFLRFNRFACVACFNLVEPNSEVNGHHGHHGHQAKSPSKSVLQTNTNPEQLSLPREVNCSRGNSDQYRRSNSAQNLTRQLFRQSR